METAQRLTTNVGSDSQLRVCEVCGNEYDKCFEVRTNSGTMHVFDSFECAIHLLAPRCLYCGVRIVGHGMEVDGVFYCCAHCAAHNGVQMKDRATAEKSHA